MVSLNYDFLGENLLVLAIILMFQLLFLLVFLTLSRTSGSKRILTPAILCLKIIHRKIGSYFKSMCLIPLCLKDIKIQCNS